MKTDKYILDKSGNPVAENDLMKWGAWMQTRSGIVQQTVIGTSKVSTVFLGLDHNFNEKGPPILWETMVFGGSMDQEQDRCAGSREQAEAMHIKMCAKVR